MSFLQNVMNQKVSPQEAAITCAVTALALSGDFKESEKSIIAAFRDQFPSLTLMQEKQFQEVIDLAVEVITKQGTAFGDVNDFVQKYMAPIFTRTEDRLAVYRYVYAVAMSNLHVDDNERTMLEALQTAFGILPAMTNQIEAEVKLEFTPLYRSLAAVVLGLIVVTADGVVYQEELDELQKGRALLEPIAHLDDMQFRLVYDMGLSVYNRYLGEEANRASFLENVVPQYLDSRELRTQAFTFAADIATSDGNLAQAEVDIMKEILKVLDMKDSVGEAIFDNYMARIKTIDGKPIA